jgi:hypothetical protein
MQVRFAPLPAPHSPTTFSNSTGPIGTKRRHAKRKNKTTKPPTPTKTVHPIKLRRLRTTDSHKHKPKATTSTATRSASRRPSHLHGTRANAKPPLRHIAATASHLLNNQPDSTQLEHSALHGHAVNPDTGKIADFEELSQCSEGALWHESNCQEIGRLGTSNTIKFINHKNVPKGPRVTYLRVVSVRWTVGGDKVDYPGEVSTKTTDMTTTKLLFNSILSTPRAKFMVGNLKDFYLGTPMDRYEYMRVPLNMIPNVILDLYDLTPLIHNGYVYCEIQRGMYGLPQAGKVANDQLIKFMKPHGYEPVSLTHGLWRHKTRPIVFTLVVDDFGVKYVDEGDVQHLLNALEEYYKVSTDWSGTQYCGLTLEWDYEKRTCDVSMPGYIERALQRFRHPIPLRPEDSPHACARPNYGAKVQYVKTPAASPALARRCRYPTHSRSTWHITLLRSCHRFIHVNRHWPDCDTTICRHTRHHECLDTTIEQRRHPP